MPINQKHTDPTYLRTIVDGLNSSALQKDNPSSLPLGLVGVYEEAIPPASQLIDRRTFLEFFGVWALMKKEVSAEFVVSLLDGWSEEEVLAFIGRYSKWFNSPMSEVYTLYHERFRTFMLQKIAESDILSVNDRIIKLCKEKLILKQGDEYERYALEHLSSHVLLAAMRSKEAGEELMKLAYDPTLWNRQIKVSNRFDWSKKMLDEMFLWALKYDESQILECSLCKVDLHYIEQNDAPQIIAMVANGEIELALERIESFGGSDEEGMKRKFTLYMLCLLELTLLESKIKPFRKSAIERLLNHLDEHLPTDHSILNWNNFFPSYLMFQMACEWAAFDIDYQVVYARTIAWEKDWISEKRPYSDLQFGVLMECARGISDEDDKSSTLKDICIELSKQGQVEPALTYSRGLNNHFWKSLALTDIAAELSKRGDKHALALVMKEALACALGISDESYRSSALMNMVSVLAKLGYLEEALACARGIKDNSDKSIAVKDIAAELAKQGQMEVSISLMQEALASARVISDEWLRCYTMNGIAAELARQGDLEASTRVIEETLACAREISDKSEKSGALTDIAAEIAKQGLQQLSAMVVQEAITCAQGIGDEWLKSAALKIIAVELGKQGHLEEALACARVISDELQKSGALKDIGQVLYNQFQPETCASLMQEALAYALGISDEVDKSNAVKDIANELIKQGLTETTANVMQIALAYGRGNSSEMHKSDVLRGIAAEFAKKGQLEEALVCVQSFKNQNLKSLALRDIALEMAKHDQSDAFASVIEDAIACARGISDQNYKVNALKEVSAGLAQQGEQDASASVMKEALSCALGIGSERYKSYALEEISAEWAKRGYPEEALECASYISVESSKSRALKEIGTVLAKQGHMEEALACAFGITDERCKSNAIENIAAELAKQGHLEEALTCARGISDESYKSSALTGIATELTKQKQQQASELVIHEALACARGLIDDSDKCAHLKAIASELVKQGRLEASTSVILEALSCARGIIGDSQKSSTLKSIAIELSEQGNWSMAEKTGSEISLIDKRHGCWKEMAKVQFKARGSQKALLVVKEFNTLEAKLFYLTGWAENVNLPDVNDTCLMLSLPMISGDNKSIENLLQKYAVQQVFMDNPTRELTDRLNRTLNIQWALDIKNSLNEK